MLAQSGVPPLERAFLFTCIGTQAPRVGRTYVAPRVEVSCEARWGTKSRLLKVIQPAPDVRVKGENAITPRREHAWGLYINLLRLECHGYDDSVEI